MGAWIETQVVELFKNNENVASYMGAWIETPNRADCCARKVSHPTWVRGLKHTCKSSSIARHSVASYMGAWIETRSNPLFATRSLRRILHGCVD